MLEKPDIPEGHIITRLQDEYKLQIAQVVFLALGADVNTAVYRVVADDGTAYFLKFRKNVFDKISVAVPLFLKSQGIETLIVPLETKSKQRWADFGDFKMILYPFIEGKNGFEIDLSDQHRKTLGMALKSIHTAKLPQELKNHIPRETYASQWRESVKSFLARVESNAFDDPTAVKLAKFMKSRSSEINRLIEHAEQLASELQSKPLELVLCHSDIHGGNILISNNEKLYIIDWDNPILAPKERDLMFIGGGIDEIWKSEREEAMFYEGYGKTEINLAALAYYRYERIIQDLAVIGEQLFLTNEGGADRERSYGWFTSNFESGNTIEIAHRIYMFLGESKTETD